MHTYNIKDTICRSTLNYQVKVVGPFHQNIVCSNEQNVSSLVLTNLYEFHFKSGWVLKN